MGGENVGRHICRTANLRGVLDDPLEVRSHHVDDEVLSPMLFTYSS
jgi:hypothetical protein